MAYNDEQGGGFQRKMYQGNWKCAKCGTDITELPFEPDPNRLDQLLCRECHKQNRPFRGGGGRSFRGGNDRRF
jgi:CxxC-x17-CxxC domain-containing protein